MGDRCGIVGSYLCNLKERNNGCERKLSSITAMVKRQGNIFFNNFPIEYVYLLT